MDNFLKGRRSEVNPNSSMKKGNQPKLLEALLGAKEGDNGLDMRVISEAGEGEHAPRVQVVMENNVVSSILVTCACGQHVELVCDYRR